MFIQNLKRFRLLSEIAGSETYCKKTRTEYAYSAFFVFMFLISLRAPAQSDTTGLLYEIESARKLTFTARLNEALPKLDSLKRRSEMLDFKKGMAMVNASMATYNFYSKKYQEAEKLSKTAIKQLNDLGEYRLEAMEHVWLGYIYGNQHKYVLAKESHLKALKLARKTKAINEETKALIALGELYFQLGNYDECTKYTLAAQQLSKENKLDLYLANCYWNLGNVAQATGNFKGSQAHFFKAYEVYNDMGMEVHAYSALGNALEMYREMGQPERAFDGFFKIFNWQKSKNDDWGLISSYMRIGQMYIDLKQFDKAEDFLNQALELAEKFNAQYIVIDIYSKMVELYFLKGDVKKGEANQNHIKSLRDSLYTSDYNQALADFDTKYETAEKEAQLTEARLEITRKRNWITGLSVGLGSLIITVFLLWRIFSIKSQSRETERLKNMEIDTQQKLISAREIERKRIAKELHDSVGSQLTVVSTSLDNAFYQFENRTLEPEKLENISTGVRLAAQSLRDTIWATYNTEVTVADLKSRIQEFVKKFTDENSFRIEMNFTGDEIILSPIEGLNVFRIIQEALNNTLKYAMASLVTISGKFTRDAFTLEISDNGKGFDPESKNRLTTFGLNNMKSRAEELGATFEVSSKEGFGTRIMVKRV